jgi:hypothetical protein
MSPTSRPLLAASFVFMLACGVTFTTTERVAVTEGGSTEANRQLADAVVTEVWRSGLQQQVATEFPMVGQEALGGLGIRSMTIRRSGSQPTVVIECSFVHPQGMDGKSIVGFCAERVRSALRVHEAGNSAA